MKRVLALMLIFSITAGSVLGLTGCEDKQLKIMTKGEWAQKLAEELQMDSCEVTEPVYADVNKDNTYYNAVQNCAAWDIFDKTENFEPDSEATVYRIWIIFPAGLFILSGESRFWRIWIRFFPRWN